MTDFHHTLSTAANGVGAVFDIQQGADGYIWLTTSTGVFRFDGVRFQSVEEATNGAVQNGEIHSVFLSSSGGLWLKTRGAGLVFWKDGRLTAYPDRRCTPVLQMEGLAEDRDGSLWVQGSGGLFHLKDAVCRQIGMEHGYTGGFPEAILVDSRGTVWVRTLAGGLLFLPHGEDRFQLSPYAAGPTSAPFVLATASYNAFLHEAPDGSIWLSDDYGLRRVTSPGGRPPFSSSAGKGFIKAARFGDFTFTADRSLWVTTDKGVRRFDHVEQWRTPFAAEDAPGETFSTVQGLRSNTVWKVLIDREGSIWLGTNSGLDRLRRTDLSTLALPLAEEHDFSLAAGDGGSVWTGNRGMPLTQVAVDGSTTNFPATRGVICVRRDRNGTIWSAGGGDPLIWRYSGKRLSALDYPEATMGPVISIAVDRNNDLWISTGLAGTYRFSGGTWSDQSKALEKKPGILGTMAGDDAGNVWFGFSNKLVRWDGSGYREFAFEDTRPGVSESTLSVRGDHVWLGGSGGVELFTQGHFYVLRWKDRTLPGRVTGVVETSAGELWMNGSSGVTHVSASELARWLGDPASAISAEHFDVLDGLPGFSAERIPEPSVVESSDGRLWFATAQGIAWLNPANLHTNRNTLAPPVIISSIISNGKTYRGLKDLHLPAHTEELEIDYTALSLAVPERVLFRYKLDGVDKDWQNAGTRRQAFYTNLPPGQYRFRVTACNNDGVWNESGATLGFTLAPIFYQTRWFKVLLLFAAMALIWWMVRLRIRSITNRLQDRLAERLAERERIARELHDTLLQGFLSASMQVHVANDLLPSDSRVKPTLTRALQLMGQVIEEGRNAVRGLRSSKTASLDLEQALSRIQQELIPGHEESAQVEFRVVVDGQRRPLRPLLRDEVYRIGREALLNAFRHARAKKIELELKYSSRRFCILVRDDGCGIDPDVLQEGRDGHWGLSGMRERADRIGAHLHVMSGASAGTEIELSVPANIAFQGTSGRTLRWFSIATRQTSTQNGKGK